MRDDGSISEDGNEWVTIDDPCIKILIKRYIDRRKDDLGLLRSSLANGDFDYIRRQGHNLAGSGSAYGLERISEIGMALLEAACTKDSETIQRGISDLESYIRKLRIQ